MYTQPFIGKSLGQQVHVADLSVSSRDARLCVGPAPLYFNVIFMLFMYMLAVTLFAAKHLTVLYPRKRSLRVGYIGVSLLVC